MGSLRNPYSRTAHPTPGTKAPCLSISTPATFLLLRRQGSGATTSALLREMLISLDLYTRNIPLTQKARFWGNYVSALKGNADLCAGPEPRVINYYPSITETLPPTYPDLRHEFGKLE